MSELAGVQREAERAALEALSPRRRFENLLDRHEARLRRVAFGMLGDPHRVDDVLQEAFIKAYCKLPPRFENELAESAWLCRIVHRCCLDELRSRRRRPEAAGLPDVAAPEVPESALAIAAALSRLGPELRAVVLLVDVVGLDYETAGVALQIPRGTVASRLSAARSRLQELLA